MENLVRVVMITTRPGEVQPCIRILRGAWIAATEQGATFKVEVTFQYASNGTQARAGGGFLVRDMIFRQQLDSMWVRAVGTAIHLPAAPDPDQQWSCGAKLSISTVAGEHVDCSPLETVQLTPVRS